MPLKRKNLGFTLLIAITCMCNVARGQEFASKTIVVRFAAGSAMAKEWISSNRNGAFAEWTSVIGNNSSRPFISDAVLTSVGKKLRTPFSNAATDSPIDRLYRTAVVTYESDVTPEIAAKKLLSFPGVLQSSPLPIEHLVAIPNDPLFGDQYHHGLLHSSEAWEIVRASGKEIVVGVVDTGIDTTHEDLQQSIWRNPGETGRDGQNRDKRYNNVDDDNNGFVDDWFGWDFAGRNGNDADNSPLPGNEHGTHVGGIVAAVIDNGIGVAGTACNVKVMPCKVGRDSPSWTSVEHTSEAILYAAANGASVINCSFGSTAQTFANEDVIAAVVQMGTLIVAAAGNESKDQVFYPAAHAHVMSVASTDDVDEKSVFSNVNGTVDVSAPGSRILSTIPGNEYAREDGTSMASPVAAGIAAMAKAMDSTLSADQLRAVVKANTDNIDVINPSFVGRMGTGRVNALKTVQRQQRKFAEISSYTITDSDADSLFMPGDTLHIKLAITNILDPLTSASITASAAPAEFSPEVLNGSAIVGPMLKSESKLIQGEIVIVLPTDVRQNAQLSLLITIADGAQGIGRDMVVATVNPTFRTIHENDIAVSVNSVGNIGYNDYPENTQGIGLTFKNGSASLLFEGAFMLGTDQSRLSDVARASSTRFRNYDFTLTSATAYSTDSVVSGARVVCEFNDANAANAMMIDVKETVLERTEDSLKNVVFVVYDFKNRTQYSVDNIHAAIFMDWDVGTAGASNGCAWENNSGIGVIQHSSDLSLPSVGVSMISEYGLDFFAIDNGGSAYSPSIYDNFTDAEKWMMMSSGLARTNSSITDVAVVIGGGPFSIAPGESKQMCFLLSVGSSFSEMKRGIIAGRNAAPAMGLNAIAYSPLALSDNFLYVENGNAVAPGPTTVAFELRAPSRVTIDIVDLFGRQIGETFHQDVVPAGKHQRVIQVPNAATGTYFIRFETASDMKFTPIQIIP